MRGGDSISKESNEMISIRNFVTTKPFSVTLVMQMLSSYVVIIIIIDLFQYGLWHVVHKIQVLNKY